LFPNAWLLLPFTTYNHLSSQGPRVRRARSASATLFFHFQGFLVFKTHLFRCSVLLLFIFPLLVSVPYPPCFPPILCCWKQRCFFFFQAPSKHKTSFAFFASVHTPTPKWVWPSTCLWINVCVTQPQTKSSCWKEKGKEGRPFTSLFFQTRKNHRVAGTWSITTNKRQNVDCISLKNFYTTNIV